jgi:hypothetical protein
MGRMAAERWKARTCLPEVVITGSLQFESMLPTYHAPFETYDKVIVGETQCPFILVNTRFALANPIFRDSSKVLAETVTDASYRRKRSAAKGRQILLMNRFIEMVANLASRFPRKSIVLRPHPAEDRTIYAQRLERYTNVIVDGSGDVGAWIRNAEIVIHNGCTTALQAHIAQRPVITWTPPESECFLTPRLPNTIGAIVTEEEDIFQMVSSGQQVSCSKDWQRTVSQTESSKLIVQMVDAVAPPVEDTAALIAAARYKAHLFSINEKLRRFASAFRPRGERNARDKLFDEKQFDRQHVVASGLKKHWGARFEVNRLADGCWAYFPEKA